MKQVLALTALAVTASYCGMAGAQQYPAKPIRMIVGAKLVKAANVSLD